MSTTLRIVLIILAVMCLEIFDAVMAEPARCDYCTPAPCYSASMCNAGCVCMKPSDFVGGTCVAFK